MDDGLGSGPRASALGGRSRGNERERVRVLFADQLNLARGKYMTVEDADKGEARFCLGAYAVTYARQMVDVPGGGLDIGLPDVTAVFDPKTLRRGWEPSTQIAIADLSFQGQPLPLCGRTALKRAINAWQDLGYNPMIGLEAEAYILQRDSDGRWVPYDTPGAFVYGTGPFSDPEGLVEEIWKTADVCGFQIESMNAEFDTPQFELALKYGDALSACDDYFLFRAMAREVLYKRGYLLSFLPKPFADRSGTGLHINISFQDDNGKNAFSGGTLPGQMNDLIQGSIAGLLHHHAGLAAVLAPIVNSYERLKPGMLTGYWANWGHDHRGAAVRVSAETGAGARIEQRTGDCAANPYVAVAAVLQAALLGFKNNYSIPPAQPTNELDTANTKVRVADNLGLALDDLLADEALVDAIGRPLIANLEGLKRAEIAELSGKSAEDVFKYYVPFI